MLSLDSTVKTSSSLFKQRNKAFTTSKPQAYLATIPRAQVLFTAHLVSFQLLQRQHSGAAPFDALALIPSTGRKVHAKASCSAHINTQQRRWMSTAAVSVHVHEQVTAGGVKRLRPQVAPLQIALLRCIATAHRRPGSLA